MRAALEGRTRFSGSHILRLTPEATHDSVYEPELDEPEDPDVDEPLDEPEVPVLVDGDVDVDVLSELDEVPEEAAGLAPSPAGFLA